MPRKFVGDRENELLHFVVTRAPITARQITDVLCPQWGVRESTITNMLERLREYHLVTREKVEGVYHYSPSKPDQSGFAQLCEKIRSQLFGGSFAPLFSYLSRPEKLTDNEVAELRKLVEQIDARERAGQP
jgi:predicted transcriptional regulator